MMNMTFTGEFSGALHSGQKKQCAKAGGCITGVCMCEENLECILPTCRAVAGDFTVWDCFRLLP